MHLIAPLHLWIQVVSLFLIASHNLNPQMREGAIKCISPVCKMHLWSKRSKPAREFVRPWHGVKWMKWCSIENTFSSFSVEQTHLGCCLLSHFDCNVLDISDVFQAVIILPEESLPEQVSWRTHWKWESQQMKGFGCYPKEINGFRAD